MSLRSVLLMIGVCAAIVLADSCTMQVTNTLKHDAILLCGRENGGMPGARFKQLVQPGAVYSYPCPETTATTSYEVYFAIRNDTECTWDACTINTGTCKSYPWVIGEGISWQNGYWYGFVAANFDGAGLGFTGNYGGSSVQYGVQMNCSSYGTTPWEGTCGVSNSNPYCNPNQENFPNKPDSGVVACGPAHNQGTITVSIFESS